MARASLFPRVSSSSNRALFTFPTRSIISARHVATVRTSPNRRFTDMTSIAANAARTHRESTPTPKPTIASSTAFRSRSSQGSALPDGFLPLPPDVFCDFAEPFFLFGAPSSSSSDSNESSSEESSSSPRPRFDRFPTIPPWPSLYESYIPFLFRGPVTLNRSSRCPYGSGKSLCSLDRLAASGNALAQKSSASKSGSSFCAVKVAVLKVFPFLSPILRDSARLLKMSSISSFANFAASSPDASRNAPCTPYFSRRLIFSASSLALPGLSLPIPPPSSPPPSTASSSPYFFALVSNKLCSYVAFVTSRYTLTSLVCPIR
mmetsp:Transcript_2093/g.7233  ORF Transcript_2093/g.7233 Transcript_2093/m.7233 type:complete len:319 (+) Transcript_2093:1777-2733(+)